MNKFLILFIVLMTVVSISSISAADNSNDIVNSDHEDPVPSINVELNNGENNPSDSGSPNENVLAGIPRGGKLIVGHVLAGIPRGGKLIVGHVLAGIPRGGKLIVGHVLAGIPRGGK